jgi:hypothetical protein
MKPSDWKSNWVGLAAEMRGGPKAVKIKTLQLGEKEAGAGCKPDIHISHEGRERIFFLTTPFIGQLDVSRKSDFALSVLYLIV